MTREELQVRYQQCFQGLDEKDLPPQTQFKRGKVRDIVDLNDELLIMTSDRISAFDRVLGLVPCKGEVLHRLSVFWFNKTKDIIGNHLKQTIGSRTMVVKKCEILPVEVVVRAYLTGSAYRDYQEGKTVSGITLPRGMQFNRAFDEPIITPSTKAEKGDHDRPISREEIFAEGLVERDLWREIEQTALALFERGREQLACQGLILVDTKYEFGLLNGDLVLADEIHTPDSSRFWFADSYEELFKAGKRQRKLDKEYLRGWLMDQGFLGEGGVPNIPEDVFLETAKRYIDAYEKISGESFPSDSVDPADEINQIRFYIEEKLS